MRWNATRWMRPMQCIDQSRPGVPPLLRFAWLRAVWNASGRWFRAGARGRRKTAPGASQPEAPVESLARVIADLELLNQNTEQDFLRIGGKLAEFIEAVDLISSQLTALTSSDTSEPGMRASQALTCALNRSREMKVRSADNNSVLD